MLHRRRFIAGLAALSPGAALAQASPASDALRALAAGETVALIRHATAPGTGDPPNFRLGDCSTQRNLSDAGRRQAAEMGRKLREAGVLVTEVHSSRWCRALDTAKLAFPEVPVTPDPALDSFFDERGNRERQTDQARTLVASWRGRQGTLVLITHQVNITALTDLFPAEGEIIVLRPTVSATITVVGRVRL
jgi:broad specificity phosphatase PhoE